MWSSQGLRVKTQSAGGELWWNSYSVVQSRRTVWRQKSSTATNRVVKEWSPNRKLASRTHSCTVLYRSTKHSVYVLFVQTVYKDGRPAAAFSHCTVLKWSQNILYMGAAILGFWRHLEPVRSWVQPVFIALNIHQHDKNNLKWQKPSLRNLKSTLSF